MTRNAQPIVILVEPQLGANIGMCARAMLNCGLDRLRLVNPREEWPNESARATAADADVVLDGAKVFSAVGEAVADCHRIFATTARDRSSEIPVLLPEEASREMCEAAGAGQNVAILFGPEASGLDGDAVTVADRLVRFPTNPEFPSLNLAQAVLLFGWEWKKQAGKGPPVSVPEAATREELDGFLCRLESELEERQFFLTPELKPATVRSVRSLFTKTNATSREVKLLHGMLTALVRDGVGRDSPEGQ